MAVTKESMLSWCQVLLGVKPRPKQTLAEYLAAIPRCAIWPVYPAALRCSCVATWMPSRVPMLAMATFACDP